MEDKKYSICLQNISYEDLRHESTFFLFEIKNAN